MKHQTNSKLKTISSRMLVVTLVLFLMTATKGIAQCPGGGVDLQAVSLDPALSTIAIGQATTITAVMANNGPCAIPIGAANVQITMSSVELDLGTPFSFTSNCGQWSYLGNVPGGSGASATHNLFFRNDAGAIPKDGPLCFFAFDVKGKAGTTAPGSFINLASSVPGDLNGANQGTTTFITVSGTPDLTFDIQAFNTLSIAAGGSIQQVLGIKNQGSGPTTAPSVFTVSNYSAGSGLTAVSNNSASVTIGFTNYTLTNATDWVVTQPGGVGTPLFFTSALPIAPGQTKYVGVTINRVAGANGTVTSTGTITSGTGGGETPTNNNSITNTITKN